MRQIVFKSAVAGYNRNSLVVAIAGHASAQGILADVSQIPIPKNPRSNSIFIYKMKHGQTKTDQLTVVNSTDTKQTITIGSVDGVASNTGAFSCREEVEPVRDSGGWVHLSTRKVTLEAGRAKTLILQSRFRKKPMLVSTIAVLHYSQTKMQTVANQGLIYTCDKLFVWWSLFLVISSESCR